MSAPARAGDSVYPPADARQGPTTRLARRLAARARARRHDLYRRAMSPRTEERVLDVGCGRDGLAAYEPQADVTGLDSQHYPEYPGTRMVVGDARELPFADGEFDIAYSNSLVEHIDHGDRERFAAEIRRVSRRFWVQTPNRWFPLEPHVLIPGYQWLPERFQRPLWRLSVLRGDYVPIELLDAAELGRLFPDAVILRERAAGLTKSLIAAGPAELVAYPPGSAR